MSKPLQVPVTRNGFVILRGSCYTMILMITTKLQVTGTCNVTKILRVPGTCKAREVYRFAGEREGSNLSGSGVVLSKLCKDIRNECETPGWCD